MFAALYFVQGVIQAYQLNFFKPHMEDEQISADQLAIVASLALLPFVIKLIYGVISDRWSLFGRGHRVPYMQIGLVATGLAFLIAFFIDPGANFGVLAAVVLAATFFMALFDTTADALAVDVMAPADHGRVQAWMTGGRAVGMILLSLGLGLVAERWGYQYTFLVIAVLMLIPLWWVSRVREPEQRTPAHTFDRRAFRAMLQPRYLLFGLFLVLAWFFFQGIEGLVTYYMSSEVPVGLDSSPRTIGFYGSLKGIGMVIGAVGVARIVTRFNRRTAALVTVGAVLAGGVMFSLIESESLILWAAPLWGIAVGLQWTTYVTMAMGITDTRIAASMFAILQTMANIGMGAAEGVATGLTDTVSFSTLFLVLGLANLVLIPLIFVVTRKFASMWKRTETDLVIE
jgi:PAT family beta-lactamase induction signal transducer AmpG